MKNQPRNIETFKVGATRVNEFDFHKHQAEMHKHQSDLPDQDFIEPETTAQKVARLTKQAHEKVSRRKKRR